MTKRWALPLLVGLCLLAYLLPLSTHGLWIPDETRYAQISQDMLLSGNWVSPHFMSLRYFEKPIAGYWMIALGQDLFGQNLFGVRFVSALSTGLSVLLCASVAVWQLGALYGFSWRHLGRVSQIELANTAVAYAYPQVYADLSELHHDYARFRPSVSYWHNWRFEERFTNLRMADDYMAIYKTLIAANKK